MEKATYKCFIPTTKSAIQIPGSDDVVKLRLVFPDEKAVPLFIQLRGKIFTLRLYPVDVDGDEGTEFCSKGLVSPIGRAITISGTSGAVISFDILEGARGMASLVALREQLLYLEVSNQ